MQELDGQDEESEEEEQVIEQQEREPSQPSFDLDLHIHQPEPSHKADPEVRVSGGSINSDVDRRSNRESEEIHTGNPNQMIYAPDEENTGGSSHQGFQGDFQQSSDFQMLMEKVHQIGPQPQPPVVEEIKEAPLVEEGSLVTESPEVKKEKQPSEKGLTELISQSFPVPENDSP